MSRITMHVDLTALLRKMDAVLPHLNKTRDTVLKEMAATVVRKTIKVTPPASAGVFGGAAKKQGAAIIGGGKGKGGDIRRVYPKPSDAYARIVSNASKGAANEFWSFIKKKNWEAAQKILDRITPGWRLVPFDDGAAHRAARVRGRVPKGFRPAGTDIIADTSWLDDYIKTRTARVGLYASALLGAALDLGITTTPAWIARHEGKLHSSAVLHGTGEHAFLLIKASVPFAANDTQRRLRYEVADTYKKLPARIRHITRAATRAGALS